MDQQKIGAFIKEMRKELGLTQSQLAEKLNISNKAISKWETGGGMPDVSLITPLCEALNITSEELFAGEKATVPKDESQPVKAKKRYDIVAFIIVFIFIALILVFLIMLSKKISIDKNEISAPTLTSTVTNERTPTIIYTPTGTLILTPTETLIPTPTDTLILTPTGTLAPTPTGTPTPTVTQKPTATPVPTATPTLAPTPTPVWGERVIDIDFEEESDLAGVTPFSKGNLQLIAGNGGRVLEYSGGTRRWASPAILLNNKLESESIYLFECDICFIETPDQTWEDDKTQISIPLYLRNSVTFERSGIGVAYIPNEENTWFHISVVLDINGKNSTLVPGHQTIREAKYENFDILCYDTIIDESKQNTVLIDNIVITREAK